KVDPRSTLRPGDATVDDYRALQKRIGTSRNVIVQPSTYGTENAPTLDALVAFGPSARAVVVVDTTVTDAELKRMHNLGARGIRFNLAQAGATKPEKIGPLSKRGKEPRWHIPIHASAPTTMEIMPILGKSAVVDRVRPLGPHSRAGWHQRSLVRQGPRLDGQGQDLGQIVRRLC